jgi:hypothetical protein
MRISILVNGVKLEIIGPENGRAEVLACGRWLQSYVNADMCKIEED